ncbi:uncharacterized protein LOC144663575 isoform X3 [Oculina patagonica]
MENISRSSKTSTNKSNGISVKKNLGGEDTAETHGVCVGDVPSTNKHEPLDASHGTQIMVREYKQEKEQLEEKIAILEAQYDAKEKEIAFFKEIVSAKNKEISHLKNTVAELQLEANGQTKVIDFAKQLETIDEQLKKTKENIFQAEKNVLKKTAKVDNLNHEPELFSAEDYFDYHQPSWFDTLSNTGCLEIVMRPVRAKDLGAMKTNVSSEKPANPKMSNTAESRKEKSHPPARCEPPMFVPRNSVVKSYAVQDKQVKTTDHVKPETDGSPQKKNPFRKAARVQTQCPIYDGPPLFVPTNGPACPPKAARTTANDVEASIDGIAQKKNPFRKAARVEQRKQPVNPPPQFMAVSTAAVTCQAEERTDKNPFRKAARVFDGSLVPNTYPAKAFEHTSAQAFPHIEQQGFLSRTLGRWFGYN